MSEYFFSLKGIYKKHPELKRTPDADSIIDLNIENIQTLCIKKCLSATTSFSTYARRITIFA